MTLTELIERLEKATEGSRELDVLTANAVGVPKRKMQFSYGGKARWGWNHDSHGGADEWFRDPPRYTTSLDAALSLVPESATWSIGHESRAHTYAVVGDEAVLGATPALALCIAALKARNTGDKA